VKLNAFIVLVSSVAVLIWAWIVAVPAQDSTADKLYEREFGKFVVACAQDVMTRQRVCILATSSSGPGPLAPTALQLVIYSAHKGASAVKITNSQFGWLVTPIIFKFGSNDPMQVQCDHSRGDDCFFDGASRKIIFTGLENSDHVRIRLIAVSKQPYDFVYDLSEYRQAEQDFMQAQNRLLP